MFAADRPHPHIGKGKASEMFAIASRPTALTFDWSRLHPYQKSSSLAAQDESTSNKAKWWYKKEEPLEAALWIW